MTEEVKDALETRILDVLNDTSKLSDAIDAATSSLTDIENKLYELLKDIGREPGDELFRDLPVGK